MCLFTLVIHAFAMLSVILLLYYHAHYWGGLFILIMINGYRILKTHYWYNAKKSCRCLLYDSALWKLRIDNAWIEGQLQPDSTVTRYYMVLIFQTAIGKIPIVIFPDSLDSKTLRHLRVCLKFDYQPPAVSGTG